jgi:hypothetical protein
MAKKDKEIWDQIYPKYIPVGKMWSRVEWLGDKPLYGTREDFEGWEARVAELNSLLPLVEAEYGARAEVKSTSVEHGYSGRDGGVSNPINHHDVYIEIDNYSSKDYAKMLAEYFAKKYPGLGFKKPPPAPAIKRREYSIEKKFNDLLKSKRNKDSE